MSEPKPKRKLFDLDVGAVRLPMLPNFLFVEGMQFAVEQVSDESLRKIGRAWTAALVRHAQKRRKPQ